MAGRKADSGIRSGRFEGPTAAQPIIVVQHSTVYRFFNTGKVPFNVQIPDPNPSNPPNTLVTLDRQSSADVKIAGGKSVVIGAVDPAKQSNVKGVYSLLAPTHPIRSGHFKSKTPATATTILHGRKSNLYRVYNSGEATFKVMNTPDEPEVIADCSLDLLVAKQVTEVTGANNTTIAGVYESLLEGTSVRSGRFTFQEANSPIEHLIIDFRQADSTATPVHRFRITNGGDTSFLVLKDGGSILGADVMLGRGQSIDFQIVEKEQNKIEVKGNADEQFTGIYDYLGTTR